MKVLDSSGNGLTSWIAAGIEWAATNGADVINLSLGCIGCKSPLIEDAIDMATASGAVVVAAAGNLGAGFLAYPASHPDVIAVGATDLNSLRAPYSNWGPGLDLVAPGGDLTQDANGDSYGDGVLQETFGSEGWGYYFNHGTSMAAPHVSAAAAILKSVAPSAGPESIRRALAVSAADLGSPGYDCVFGSGLLQVDDAIDALGSVDTSSPQWPAGADVHVKKYGENRSRHRLASCDRQRRDREL